MTNEEEEEKLARENAGLAVETAARTARSLGAGHLADEAAARSMESLLTAIRTRHRASIPLKSWVAMIVRRDASDLVDAEERRHRLLPGGARREWDYVWNGDPANNPSPATDAEGRDEADGMLATLGERERAVVRAVAIEGKTLEEAGREGGRSKTQAWRDYRDALAELRRAHEAGAPAGVGRGDAGASAPGARETSRSTAQAPQRLHAKAPRAKATPAATPTVSTALIRSS